MGQFYNVGETKIRPGVYKRYSNVGASGAASAIYGIGAIPIQADWGDFNVHHFSGSSMIRDIKNTYGSGGTVDAAIAFANGGASELYVVRLNGSDGKNAKWKSEDGHTTLTAKYIGATSLSVTIKDSVNGTSKEVILYNGTTQLEKITFTPSESEPNGSLVDAVNAESSYIDAWTSTRSAEITNVTDSSFSAQKGVNPTITSDSYSDALALLESSSYNVLALDTTDADIAAVAAEYVIRVHKQGKHVMFVTGSPTSSVSDNITTASAYNDEKIIYIGGNYTDSSGTSPYDYIVVATAAGVIASTQSNRSIVHKTIPGAASLGSDVHTNDEYEEAIQGGVLMFSTSSDGTVWFDSGVNTLTTPDDTQDDGWKKIKRVAVRFELFDRIDRTFEPKVGRINCDADGIGDLIQSGQKVIDTMISEGKLSAGTIYEDTANPHQGDSAWFIIDADDIDALEKIYLHYQFRYSTAS